MNAVYVDPQYITKVRKKLALDQREAVEIFWRRRQRVFTLRKRQNQATVGIGEIAQNAVSSF